MRVVRLFNWPTLSLRKTLFLGVGLCMVLPALVLAYVQSIRAFESNVRLQVQAPAARTANVLSLGLVLPIWSADRETVADLVAAAMSNPDIASIEVMDEHAEVIVRKQRAQLLSTELIREVRPIIHAALPIGTVTLEYSTAQAKAALRTALLESGLALVGQLLVSCGFLWLLFESRIGRPLRRLQKEAWRMARGELDSPLAWRRQDEIGDLALSLDSMRTDLLAVLAERKQTALHEATHSATMTALVSGATLTEVLTQLVHGVEAEHKGTLGSVLLLDADGTHLRTGAAPSLPAFFSQAVDGVVIGPATGSCGTAVFTGKRVVVTDIATDPLWAEYKALAAQAGLAACWSEPICGSGGRVLGTFAFYYTQPRVPAEAEIRSIVTAAQLAAVAIERKQVEAAVRRSQQMLERAEHAARLGSWEWDARTDTVTWSAETYRFFGRDPALGVPDLAGQSALYTPADTQRLFETVSQALVDGLPYDIELCGVRPDGELRYCHILGTPERDASGKVVLLAGSLQDVTERRLAQVALEATNRELARSNAELEQFAYAASHDLQEPLRSISSCVQLLQLRYHGKLDARADEFIEHAVSGSQRMLAMIEDLLAFSRIGSKPRPWSPVDSGAALETALSNLAASMAESSAHITHDPMPQVNAHPGQLTQVFQNLVGNALKFRGEKPAVVHVGARRQGAEWVFSVADQGIGISAQHFDRIFGLFKRLHGRAAYPGTGIGLTICKKIVERHGGRIWVESAPEQGARFFFTLPVQALSTLAAVNDNKP